MILYVRDRRLNLALSGAMLAALLFGCFLFGALSVRSYRELALIGVLFCVAVYRIKPQLMVCFALFAAYASMPDGVPPPPAGEGSRSSAPARYVRSPGPRKTKLSGPTG